MLSYKVKIHCHLPQNNGIWKKIDGKNKYEGHTNLTMLDSTSSLYTVCYVL